MSDIVVDVGSAGSGVTGHGPCEAWATSSDLCSPCDDYALDSVLVDDALDIASEVLYVLSGRQFPGVCSETIRPVFCGSRKEIKLTSPVVEVTEVKVDGEVLVEGTDYRVDDYSKLRRLDDEVWPGSQDLDLEDTEEDTFSVTYSFGAEPPDSGVKAAAVLACEIVLACQPELAGQCRLPKNVTSVTRQGVTTTKQPLIVALEGGQTGIYEIDLFLTAWNPHKLRRRSRVLSPDLDQRNRRVST